MRGIGLFNHASPGEKNAQDNRINMLASEYITYCICQKEVQQMFLDSVRSLLMCNLFSHALFVATSQIGFLIHNENVGG